MKFIHKRSLLIFGLWVLCSGSAHSLDLANLEACQLTGRDDIPLEALCADTVYPENYDNEGGTKISLPLVVVKASMPSDRPPLLLLQGGPGASNIWQNPDAWMYRDQDLIMLGYRGADGSPILNCPNMRQAQLGVDGDLLGEASLKQFADAVAQCASDITAGGMNLKNFSMVQVVEDLENLRQALGIEHFNLLSESYGTRLAQIYSWKYPGSIARSVMIGVNPPGHFVWEPDLIDEQIRYVSSLCKLDSFCSSKTDNFAESVRRVAKNPPRSWLGFPIDPGVVRFLGFNFMHNVTSAPLFYDTVLAADNGDASGLALMTLMYRLQVRFGDEGPFGDLFSKGLADYEPERDYAKDMNPPTSIMGSPMSELLMSAADKWPAGGIPENLRTVQQSDVETLLINGSVDFSTPLQNGRDELLPHLSNGHLVELKELGHVGDVYWQQPEAAERLILGFFHDGQVDSSGFVHQPLSFKPKYGFPFIMKAALSAVGLVALLLIGLITWLVRRRGRSR